MATKIRPKLAELETLEGGGAGGMGGGSGVSGTKWSNMPSFRGKANTIDDIKKLTRDTSHLKGSAKESVELAKDRAASRTAVRAAGAATAGAGIKSMMSGDGEPAQKSNQDTDESNFKEAERTLREADADIKDSKYGKGDKDFKRGGGVKKMAKGGVTRADGCISKGHTKGRMV